MAAAMPACAQTSWRDSLWTVIYGSVEVEALSTFAAAGVKRGLALPALPGSVFVSTSYGMSLSDADRARRSRIAQSDVDMQARLMVGFEQSAGAFFTSASLGPAMARIKRQYASGSQTRAGIVGNLDLWWRPASDIYLTWTLTGDTAELSLWNRWRVGWKPAALPFAVGPEFAAGVGRNWSKLKAGVHIGDLAIWKFGFTVSGGWMIDERNRSGGYGSAALFIRY